MNESTTVEIDDIGPVLFEQSQRAKHMNITIKPFKGIRVAVPKGVSLQSASQFVHTKKSWIQKHLAKIKQLEKQQISMSKSLADLDKVKAKEKLIDRLNELAELHGFSYNKVTIRNQKTKWGSCSVKNNISLNIQLACLPQELIDYVILHELVHTRIKNHSQAFWLELDKYVGNAKALRSRLNEAAVPIRGKI